ncbi:hypothetical protein JCM19236_3045 [Vibrio sp. JCM 19236]|nr:hypothetical protein JCM19236_3045 [Vibrio sp. JCM 19236]
MKLTHGIALLGLLSSSMVSANWDLNLQASNMMTTCLVLWE